MGKGRGFCTMGEIPSHTKWTLRRSSYIVITGATSGIGLAAADDAFAEQVLKLVTSLHVTKQKRMMLYSN